MVRLTDAELLIELLENETNDFQKARLEMLLAHSVHHRKVSDNLSRLRRYIKTTDVSLKIENVLQNDQLMTRLHDSIIDQIESSKKNRPTQIQGVCGGSSQKRSAVRSIKASI